MEQELSTPFETLEPFDPPLIEQLTYTDIPPKMYEQAMTHKPHIRNHGTKIPMPKKPHANYPTRNTSAERWTTERASNFRKARDYYVDLKEEKVNLEQFGDSVARAIRLNSTNKKLSVNDIKRNLHRYDTGKPHTRSETATGRRSDLLELTLNKKSANYESLMEAIRKWQDRLRKYDDKRNRFHNIVGTVCRRGDQTAFHFDNLLNRTVALMEEPRIMMTTKNDYKNLLGGDCFEIDVKYSARRFLKRIPVIATTNEELGSHMPSIERAALMSRVKQYTLSQQVTSELIQGVIRPPPGQLCACHLRKLFTPYGFYDKTV
ncbi:hypothetical protein ACTXT7_016400 [Hymenolepis weldensis]